VNSPARVKKSPVQCSKACPEQSEGSFVAFVTDPSKLRMRKSRTWNIEP
jgi:hypothetical protein